MKRTVFLLGLLVLPAVLVVEGTLALDRDPPPSPRVPFLIAGGQTDGPIVTKVLAKNHSITRIEFALELANFFVNDQVWTPVIVFYDEPQYLITPEASEAQRATASPQCDLEEMHASMQECTRFATPQELGCLARIYQAFSVHSAQLRELGKSHPELPMVIVIRELGVAPWLDPKDIQDWTRGAQYVVPGFGFRGWRGPSPYSSYLKDTGLQLNDERNAFQFTVIMLTPKNEGKGADLPTCEWSPSIPWDRLPG